MRVELGLLVAAAALCGCAAPGPTAPRVGLAASALPNLGVEGTLDARVAGLAGGELRAEAQLVQQFLDDEDLSSDGNPGAGDWTQVGLGLRWVARAPGGVGGAGAPPAGLGCWELFGGGVWAHARGVPNLIDSAGRHAGVRLGFGYRVPFGRGWSLGPELALLGLWIDGRLELAPQAGWGLRWHGAR